MGTAIFKQTRCASETLSIQNEQSKQKWPQVKESGLVKEGDIRIASLTVFQDLAGESEEIKQQWINNLWQEALSM